MAKSDIEVAIDLTTDSITAAATALSLALRRGLALSTPSAPATFAISGSTQEVLALHASDIRRVYVYNPHSSDPVFLGIGAAAVLASGETIAPGSGRYVDLPAGDALNGIGTATTNISLQVWVIA